MDWKNNFESIKNKVKYQLHSKGLDNLDGIAKYFSVSNLKNRNLILMAVEL